jgi:hypothetical protein
MEEGLVQDETGHSDLHQSFCHALGSDLHALGNRTRGTAREQDGCVVS